MADTRWTEFFWKGAGAVGAGKIAPDYETTWTNETPEVASPTWHELKWPSGLGGGGFGGQVSGFGGFTPPAWSPMDFTE